MKTRIQKIGDTIIVNVDGKLDYETQIPLKEDLQKLIQNSKKDSVSKKIIFDFENLQFVGSSGISNFIQTLSEFNSQTSVKPRYCNVSNDFKRVIQALDNQKAFDFYETTEKAKKSFDQ